MVALEPSVSLRTEDPLPVIHSRWPCSADGDVKHFKSYRAAMKAHWRFAMMTALTHKDAGPMGPTPMVVKMCLSTSNWESHHISKDFATGRLVMLAMLSAPKKIVVNGAGTWHAWGQGVGSDSRSLFTVLRDPWRIWRSRCCMCRCSMTRVTNPKCFIVSCWICTISTLVALAFAALAPDLPRIWTKVSSPASVDDQSCELCRTVLGRPALSPSWLLAFALNIRILWKSLLPKFPTPLLFL